MSPLMASWNYPSSILNGPGQVSELPSLCFSRGMRKPLLVTDPGLRALPMTEQIVQICQKEGIEVDIFSDIKANPNGGNVEDGVAAYRAGEHDGVIALGGGSALDAAKAIALMVGQERPLWDFEDVGDNWSRVKEDGMAEVIAIPTTAGTGSEVGRASVITHEGQCRKVIIFHPKMLPIQIILDAELTVGLPPGLSAATGMDAFSHSLEAYCANYYHPMAEGIALESMRLIKHHLPVVYENGADIEARQHMLVASSMGATAFQRGLGAMHALAHALGALYDAHHGTLNAILMPYVLQANHSAIQERMVRLANYLDLETKGFEGVQRWILSLRAILDIPNDLSALGIDVSDADRVAQMAFEDPSAGGNPIAFSVAQYRALFIAAVEGNLAGVNASMGLD